MSDFESPLRKAWVRMSTNYNCSSICTYHNGNGPYCEGHAALLEMVDGYVYASHGENGHEECEEERRRLRASVGVSDD